LINVSPLISGLLTDLQQGQTIPVLSARFHNTLAALVLELAQRAKQAHSLDRVALSGGVWQNMSLLTKSVHMLSRAGFQVLTHHHVPPNDGGVSLGQAVAGLQFLSVED
jgi:hydrogenase maturation protein HypF